ncbi:MAG: tetratricopeptide repeat-containing sulfotransferase family protein [Rhodanobacteraceae bacterium]
MADDSVIDPIVAAIQAGDLASAEYLCGHALRKTPDDVDLLVLLGYDLQQQGRPGDALPVFARLTELLPDDGMHWGNYATALKLAGDLPAAEQAAETAVRVSPDSPERLEQLGLLKLQVCKPIEAKRILLRARELAPDSPSIAIHAARACIACRDSRADSLLQPWRTWQSLTDDLKAELADVLVQVSEPWGALELLEALIRRSPSDWSVQLLLAKVYERVNEPERAAAKLDEIIANMAASRDSDFRREVDAQRAQLAMRGRDFATARALLERAGAATESDDGHYFNLARACDGVGDVTATMEALQTAHRLQIEALQRSNPEILERGEPLLPHVDDRVQADDYHAWPILSAPDVSQSPVFVVGFPRSGTTLLEQMLDAHPRLQSMDERPFLNVLSNQLEDFRITVPQDLGRLDQRDCDELRKGYVLLGCGKVARHWDARLVDKNPLNMCWLPMIQRMFPAAQFILAVRHPCDVLMSCYLQNFRAAPLAAACQSLERLARAYVAAMECWLYHVELFHPHVLVSRYEELVADTSTHTRRIAEFLGLADAASMLHFDARAREKGFIRTPSYTQVVEPINRRAVSRWLPYREYFEPILPILAPMLEYWGYDTRPTAQVATVD